MHHGGDPLQQHFWMFMNIIITDLERIVKQSRLSTPFFSFQYQKKKNRMNGGGFAYYHDEFIGAPLDACREGFECSARALADWQPEIKYEFFGQ